MQTELEWGLAMIRSQRQLRVDSELVRKAADGDGIALGALVAQCEPAIHQFVSSLVESDNVGDVTQDVWERVSSRLQTLRDSGQFVPWLFRIARNCSVDFIRADRRGAGRRRTTAQRISTRQSGSEDPELSVLVRDAQWKVWLSLAALSAKDQQILYAREYHDRSYADIAAELGITVAAAQVRVFRAKDRFRRQFERLSNFSACSTSPLQISAYVDGTLRPQQRHALAAHIRQCEDCLGRIAAMRAGRRLFRGALITGLLKAATQGLPAAGTLSSPWYAPLVSAISLARSIPMIDATGGSVARAAFVVAAVVSTLTIATSDIPDTGVLASADPSRAVAELNRRAAVDVEARDAQTFWSRGGPALSVFFTGQRDVVIATSVATDESPQISSEHRAPNASESPVLVANRDHEASGKANGRSDDPPANGQANGRSDDPPGNGQANGRSDDPPANGPANGRSDDPPANGQANGRSDDPPGNGQANGRSDDPPGNGQANGRSDDPPANGQANGRSDDPPGNGQANGRSDDPPGNGSRAGG